MIKTPEIPSQAIVINKQKGKSQKPVIQDPWADWQPVWSKRQKSPVKTVHDLQETHSPTIAAPLSGTVHRDDRARQRRIIDARLWDALTPIQQEAALQIALSFEVMSRGLGYVSSDWRRIPGCRGKSDLSDAHSRLIGQYIDWVQICHKEKTPHALILDILVFGLSCRHVDRARRTRSGTARRILIEGIDLYCKLKGW